MSLGCVLWSHAGNKMSPTKSLWVAFFCKRSTADLAVASELSSLRAVLTSLGVADNFLSWQYRMSMKPIDW